MRWSKFHKEARRVDGLRYRDFIGFREDLIKAACPERCRFGANRRSFGKQVHRAKMKKGPQAEVAPLLLNNNGGQPGSLVEARPAASSGRGTRRRSRISGALPGSAVLARAAVSLKKCRTNPP